MSVDDKMRSEPRKPRALREKHVVANGRANRTDDVEVETSYVPSPEEQADEEKWDELFKATPDAMFDALIKEARESIRKNGTKPLDFRRQ